MRVGTDEEEWDVNNLISWLLVDEGLDKAGQNDVWGIWWLFEESAGSRQANSSKGELMV